MLEREKRASPQDNIPSSLIRVNTTQVRPSGGLGRETRPDIREEGKNAGAFMVSGNGTCRGKSNFEGEGAAAYVDSSFLPKEKGGRPEVKGVQWTEKRWVIQAQTAFPTRSAQGEAEKQCRLKKQGRRQTILQKSFYNYNE